MMRSVIAEGIARIGATFWLPLVSTVGLLNSIVKIVNFGKPANRTYLRGLFRHLPSDTIKNT